MWIQQNVNSTSKNEPQVVNIHKMLKTDENRRSMESYDFTRRRACILTCIAPSFTVPLQNYSEEWKGVVNGEILFQLKVSTQ